MRRKVEVRVVRMGVVDAYHNVHIDQLKEQHEPDGDQSVVVGPHVTHVVVELTRDTTQLCELVLVRNEPP